MHCFLSKRTEANGIDFLDLNFNEKSHAFYIHFFLKDILMLFFKSVNENEIQLKRKSKIVFTYSYYTSVDSDLLGRILRKLIFVSFLRSEIFDKRFIK